MNVIPLILTAAVTISTILYTFYSFQLWRTTRAAAEISRQAAFSNLWAELNRYLELLRQQNAPETEFLQKLSDLLLEFMFTNLIRNTAKRNEQSAVEFRQKGLSIGGREQGRCFSNSVGGQVGRVAMTSTWKADLFRSNVDNLGGKFKIRNSQVPVKPVGDSRGAELANLEAIIR